MAAQTIRVRGVPQHWDITQLQLFLQEQKDLENPRVKSLAPEISGKFLTATVAVGDVPSGLSEFGTGQTRELPLPKLDHDSGSNYLTFDAHFLGVTTLFCPSIEYHKADVIAIPGLGCHAFGSFKETGRDHMWLRDTLPFDLTNETDYIPIARVMTYGHNALVSDSEVANLQELASSFRTSLLSLVASPIARPIIFIAHSLGGLVLKEAITGLARSNEEEHRKVLEAVCGIVFFGVPQRGTDIGSPLDVVGMQPKSSLIERLARDNQQRLRIQHRDFKDALGAEGEVEVFSFFETRSSPTAQLNKSGQWTMSGPPILIVPKSSAMNGRSWEANEEHSLGIDRTHWNMVRFKLHDEEYLSVLHTLVGLVRRATSGPYRSKAIPDRDSGYASASRIATSAPSESSFRNDVNSPPEQGNHEPGEHSDEIQSIASDKDDIGSLVSHETTREGMTGKALIRVFLAEDPQFRALCKKALPKLGKKRFVENMRRLLKSFYKGLSEEARSEAEKAVARLLRGRRGRQRISNQLAIYMQEEGETWELDREKLAVDSEARDQVETWLARVAPGGPVGQEQEVDVQSMDDDSWTSSSNDDFPFTSELEAFLRQSRSLQGLLKNFTLMFLPSNLRHILQSIPKDHIWVSWEQGHSPVNRVKSWVEDSTRVRWDWWPLKPRKRMLQHGEARVFWICTCGAEQWEELSVEQCELVQQTLAHSSEELPEYTHWCRTGGSLRFSTTWFRRAIPQALLAGGSLMSSAAQRYTPTSMSSSNNHSPSQGNVAPAAAAAASSQANSPQSPAIGQQMQVPTPNTVAQPDSWILFGVQGTSRTITPCQIPVRSKATDHSVFQELRRCYQLHRGRLRLWFSIWRLDYCQSVKFQRLTLDRMVHDHKDLPTHQDYQYNPRAPATDARNPPFGPHLFQALFYTCPSPCTWPIPHECIPPPVGNTYLERIPKRGQSFEKDPTSPIWGFDAVFMISLKYLLAYQFVILVGPFVFWGWWLESHPNDLQSAAVPVTVALGSFAVFWAVSGIIPSTGYD